MHLPGRNLTSEAASVYYKYFPVPLGTGHKHQNDI